MKRFLQPHVTNSKLPKFLVKDDEEKNRLIAAGNDYNFVTNVDEILNDEEIQIVVD